MEVSVFTHNLEMTPRLQEYVERKVGKLDRYLSDVDEARVDLRVENTRSAAQRQVAQLTLRTRGTLLRAEERTNDMFTSIDAVLEKMHHRMARYKGKRQDRWQASFGEPAVPEEELPALQEEGAGEGNTGEIVRVKRFAVRPMTPEEAIEQMELLGHRFFVFLNAEGSGINVVYRRDDGNYGLLQPEIA